MSQSREETVAVIGAGVIGLTSALQLAQKGYKVEVYARDLPSDTTSTGFASPWAGANWCPFVTDKRICQWERDTFPYLEDLITAGLVMHIPAVRYVKKEDDFLDHWYSDVVRSYEKLDKNSDGFLRVKFTTVSLNAPVYCKYLSEELGRCGVPITRKVVDSFDEISADLIVNATGLGALKLCGDEDVTPIRGQTVLIRSNEIECHMVEGGPDGITYIIPRPGGEVICGGCYDKGNFDTKPDEDFAKVILERCLKYNPKLSRTGTVDGVEIIRHNVGLRPGRISGPRLELEGNILHAYGNGSAGYQGSWGMAMELCRIADGYFKHD